MPSPSIELTLPRDEASYRQLASLVRRHRKAKTRIAVVLTLAFAAGVTAIILIVRELPLLRPAALAVFLGVAGGALAGGWLGGWIQWRWETRQALREWMSSDSDVRLIVAPESVRMSFDGGEAELEWRRFERALRVDGYLLLYCSPQMAWYVPEAALSPPDFTRVLEWASAGVGSGVEDLPRGRASADQGPAL